MNLRDLTSAFDDESAPSAARRRDRSSIPSKRLVHDWTDDSGEPGDKYDQELATLLLSEASPGVELDPDLMQEFVDRLVAKEPELARFLINDPNGIDVMLLQFPTFLHEPEQTRKIQEGIEELWYGDDSAITAISDSIVSVAVTDQITEGQTESITSTIAVALVILAAFFWVTLRQPSLSFIAVGPIVLVLFSVLGTMALLNIPYTLVTSIITALSIGIGVDYTIHVIHRYREEFAHLRNPEKAAVRTLATTGSALLGSALTTAFGFGVLIASPLLASQQFGITATITIVYSLIVSVLVVLPAMVVWGLLPECPAALDGGAHVGRPRRGDRGHPSAPRAWAGLVVEKRLMQLRKLSNGLKAAYRGSDAHSRVKAFRWVDGQSACGWRRPGGLRTTPKPSRSITTFAVSSWCSVGANPSTSRRYRPWRAWRTPKSGTSG